MSESKPLRVFGRGLLLLLSAVVATASVTAKNDVPRKSVRNEPTAKTYTGTVLNKKEKPVSSADVAVEEGRTDADGVFVTKQPYGTTYAIVCDGHTIYWGTLRADVQNVCRLDNVGQTSPYGFKNPNVIVDGRYVRGCNLNNYTPDRLTVTYSSDKPFSDRVGRVMKKYAISARSIMERGIVFVNFNEKTRLVRPNRNGTYTIRVTDADGNPIEGAHVCIHRTYTDRSGNYSVQASAGDMLVLGKRKYKSQCRELGETQSADVGMKWNGKWREAENWMFPTGDNAVTKTAIMPKFRNGNLSTFLNWVRYTRYEKSMSVINNNSVEHNHQHYDKDNSLLSARYSFPRTYVKVQFVIDYDGTLTDIEVVGTDNPAMARSVVEVLKISPKWSPGRDATGEAVRVKYNVAFKFVQNLAEDYDKERAKTTESPSWGDAD